MEAVMVSEGQERQQWKHPKVCIRHSLAGGNRVSLTAYVFDVCCVSVCAPDKAQRWGSSGANLLSGQMMELVYKSPAGIHEFCWFVISTMTVTFDPTQKW